MTEPRGATAAGRTCAVAADGQRDLARCVASYANLFTAASFDASLLASVTLANAFSAPRVDADGLRLLNRTTLWAFALDWLVDHEAADRESIDDLSRRCLSVADGAEPEPGDQLGEFLASIRDELWSGSHPGALAPVWREELRRMLTAMAVEWDWKARGPEGLGSLTVEEYLDNADNLGSSFVNFSHWWAGGSAVTVQDVAEVLAAGRATQRVIRLLNDLATYERDVTWGDLNVRMLGVSTTDIQARIGSLVEESTAVLARLRVRQPDHAAFLRHQVEFCQGFYGVSDYWGAW